jgi:hypothetical protein
MQNSTLNFIILDYNIESSEAVKKDIPHAFFPSLLHLSIFTKSGHASSMFMPYFGWTDLSKFPYPIYIIPQ